LCRLRSKRWQATRQPPTDQVSRSSPCFNRRLGQRLRRHDIATTEKPQYWLDHQALVTQGEAVLARLPDHRSCRPATNPAKSTSLAPYYVAFETIAQYSGSVRRDLLTTAPNRPRSSYVL
jgi:hypothetical protein